MSQSRKDDDKTVQVSRRGFLGQASCAAVGTTALFNTALSMDMFNTLAMPCDPNDYRALVCIFLSGGNDSFNMIVPSVTCDTSPSSKNYQLFLIVNV